MRRFVALIAIAALCANAAFAIAARPARTLPGQVAVAPDPATAGQPVTATGQNIPDNGCGSVWLRWVGDPQTSAGTTFTSVELEANGTFEFTLGGDKLSAPAVYTLTVLEDCAGTTKAKALAETTFTVAP